MTQTKHLQNDNDHWMKPISEEYQEVELEMDDVLVKKLTQTVFRMKDREDKINDIRKKLQAGIYYHTSEEILEAMIEDAKGVGCSLE